MKALFWLRSDLRLADNTALHHACADADQVVALFIISPAEWNAHDFSAAKANLILRTLRDLAPRLMAANIQLICHTAPAANDVPPLVLKTARDHDCTALYFNREYELDESRRDSAVTRLLEADGIAVHSFTDQTVIEPGNVRTGDGRFFTVFTPFKNAWLRHVADHAGPPALLPPPKHCKLPLATPTAPTIPTSLKGFESTLPADLWPAGEQEAQRRLKHFTRRVIAAYHESRNYPAQDGTSTLSPYLAIGAISPRQCLAAAVAANTRNSLIAGNPGVLQWITELIWREFYIHITTGFPRIAMGRAFRPATERIRWSDNAAHFKAWCKGRTGVPIVDAGMRQLLATGWMHNRVRMITAMYFTKNLFIDWRKGEQFFMRNLVDGFFASNNGGWQWSASTGTDAAPYFRVFNPVSQSHKFDPQGEYIRRYIPELADLDDDAIHEPWSLPPLARAAINYPDPLVDLSTSRKAAIDAFSKLKSPAAG